MRHSCQAAMKACRHIYGPSYMRVFEALPQPAGRLHDAQRMLDVLWGMIEVFCYHSRHSCNPLQVDTSQSDS